MYVLLERCWAVRLQSTESVTISDGTGFHIGLGRNSTRGVHPTPTFMCEPVFGRTWMDEPHKHTPAHTHTHTHAQTHTHTHMHKTRTATVTAARPRTKERQG